jgi:hypothetical protein
MGISSAQAMKFAVSGGVTETLTDDIQDLIIENNTE